MAYRMVPFLLCVGRGVPAHHPVLSAAAAAALVGGDTPEAQEKRQPPGSPKRRKGTATRASTTTPSAAVWRMTMPTVMGDVAVRVERSPHHNGTVATATATATPSWAQRYFDLLLTAEDDTAAGEMPPSSPTHATHSATQVVKGTVTADDDPTAAPLWPPPRMANETSGAYAARCWAAYHARQPAPRGPGAVAPRSQLSSSADAESGVMYEEVYPSASLRRGLTDAATAHRCLAPHSPCRNLIGGGHAEALLAIDRYAAMVARGELSEAAACWALLCDTKSAPLSLALRTRAVEVEREVRASVVAHRRLRREGLRRTRSVVCHGARARTLMGLPSLSQ